MNSDLAFSISNGDHPPNNANVTISILSSITPSQHLSHPYQYSTKHPRNIIDNNMFFVLSIALICAITFFTIVSCCVLAFLCSRYKHKSAKVDILEPSLKHDVLEPSPKDDAFQRSPKKRCPSDAVLICGSDAVLIRNWLQVIVGLPQYADNFVNNGYDNFSTIINSFKRKDQLSAIGVTKMGHQTAIMLEIKELRKVAKMHQNQLSISTVERMGTDHDNHCLSSDHIRVFVVEENKSDTDDIDQDDDDIMQNISAFIQGKGETENGSTTVGDIPLQNDEFIVNGFSEDEINIRSIGAYNNKDMNAIDHK